MGKRTGSRDHQHEGRIAPRTKAARQCGAERQQPSHIEADVKQVGVQERVAEERPEIGAEAAGKRTAGNEIDVVACRNEGEGQQKAYIFGFGQDSMRSACTSTSTATVARTAGGTLNIGSER